MKDDETSEAVKRIREEAAKDVSKPWGRLAPESKPKLAPPTMDRFKIKVKFLGREQEVTCYAKKFGSHGVRVQVFIDDQKRWASHVEVSAMLFGQRLAPSKEEG